MVLSHVPTVPGATGVCQHAQSQECDQRCSATRVTFPGLWKVLGFCLGGLLLGVGCFIFVCFSKSVAWWGSSDYKMKNLGSYSFLPLLAVYMNLHNWVSSLNLSKPICRMVVTILPCLETGRVAYLKEHSILEYNTPNFRCLLLI